MLKINDIMSAPPVICRENDTVATVRNLMLRHNVDRVIVTPNNELTPIGVITQKDIIRSVQKSSPIWRRRPLDTVLVNTIMSPDPVVISRSAEIQEAVSILKEKGFSALPVVDDGEVVGVISKTDVIAVLENILHKSTTVKNFMVSPVITAKPSHSILYILDIMSEHNISRVVIEKNNKPVGIITSKDLVFVKSGLLETGIKLGGTFHRPIKSDSSNPKSLSKLAVLAEEIMSEDVITATEDDSVIKVAKLMVNNGIGGIPVVKKDTGEIAGIITKRDIINRLLEVSVK